MSELKIFRITGYYRKNKRKIPINMDIRALKEEDALEIMYSTVGSKHLVSRRDIFVRKDGGVRILSDDEPSRTNEYSDIDSEGFFIPVR